MTVPPSLGDIGTKPGEMANCWRNRTMCLSGKPTAVSRCRWTLPRDAPNPGPSSSGWPGEAMISGRFSPFNFADVPWDGLGVGDGGDGVVIVFGDPPKLPVGPNQSPLNFPKWRSCRPFDQMRLKSSQPYQSSGQKAMLRGMRLDSSTFPLVHEEAFFPVRSITAGSFYRSHHV
ncbi:MAG: hypothetical protein CM15mP78_09540 [Candidatus Poseidoniales archaeon]|nr:MAG: hypothetical protein CM15mP78_09540 [Candidatus Poseidoniales archaeon]